MKHQIHFGTDGWRAIIGREFTQDNLTLFNLGLAAYILDTYAEGTPLVLGYDARFMADRFAAYSAKLMNAFGVPTLSQLGHCPTPVIAHAAQTGCGAIVFTASHNPPEYMGIKYIPEYAGPSSLEITNAILERINNIANTVEIYGLGSRSTEELVKILNTYRKTPTAATNSNISAYEAYRKDLDKVIDFSVLQKSNAKEKLTVVYDPMYGAGRGFTDKLLKEAGFNVVSIHDIQDYSFGGSLPEPREDLLTELRDTVIQSGAAFGAANDGDADRFAMMSNDGGFFPANKALSIILKYLLEVRGYRGTVARTAVTTHLLDEIAAKYGCKAIETPVGFKWLCEVMRREPTVIAAEESGGMSMLGHIPEKDGLLAILMMAEVLAVTGKPLTTLWKEVQELVGKNYYYNRLDLHMDGEVKNKFIATFADPSLREIAGYKVVHIDTKEGTKVYLGNNNRTTTLGSVQGTCERGAGVDSNVNEDAERASNAEMSQADKSCAWFLARPSGTEAMCRVYVEANDEAVLAKISKELELIVAKI